ncbi:MAG TPA: hypothetical protein DDY22_14680 [Geobacter sp.]|nr:hypothetical protein [Geobacter sp.]
MVGKDKVCRCKKRHKRHICGLRAKGQAHDINLLIQNPNVACGICGETADSGDDVCLPVPLFI